MDELEEMKQIYITEGYKVVYNSEKIVGLKKSYIVAYIILFVVLTVSSMLIGLAGIVLGILLIFFGALHGFKRRVYIKLES